MSLTRRAWLLVPCAVLMTYASLGVTQLFAPGHWQGPVFATLLGLILAGLWPGRFAWAAVCGAVALSLAVAMLSGLAGSPQSGLIQVGAGHGTTVLLTLGGLALGLDFGYLLLRRCLPWPALLLAGAVLLLPADAILSYQTKYPLVVGLSLLIVMGCYVRPTQLAGALAVLVVCLSLLVIAWRLPATPAHWARTAADPLRAMGAGNASITRSELNLQGKFRPSPALVMSILLRGPDPQPLWEEDLFDYYTGTAWQSSVGSPRDVQGGQPLGGRAGGVDDIARVRLFQPATQLVFAGAPVAAGIATRTVADRTGAVSVQSYETLTSGTVYTTYAAARDDSLGNSASYLQVPAEPGRLHALAKRLKAIALAQTAANIERYLQSSRFHYNANAGSPSGEDAVTAFLFHSHQGYCNQFATAMAVLARLDGIPSRVVAGYAGGTLTHGVWLIRERDAHSWVQLYLPVSGWTVFDPTPGTPSSGPIGHAATVQAHRETAPVPVPQSRRARSAPRLPLPLPAHVHSDRRQASQRSRLPWLPLTFAIAMLAFLLVALAAVFRPRSLDTLYASLAGGGAGRKIGPSQTPFEFAAGFPAEAESDIRMIVSLYSRQLFAGRRPEPDELDAARGAWKRRVPMWKRVL
ncbi:MAG: transglutaminase-like domain-containing protein [Chloroflexota bacterium]